MEYRTSAQWLGLPLVHIVTGSVVDGVYRRGVATGWIALGDVAFGVLFSLGGVAVGGVSLGGVAIGIVSLGGLALGVAALGGLAVGVVAAGGAAFAWYAAIGGLAVAHYYAIGGAASALHVLAPASNELWTHNPIPRAPFRISDAALLLAIAVGLLVLARFVHESRKR